MTDEDKVNVFFLENVNVDVLVLGPIGSHEGLDVDFWVTFSDDDLLFFFDNNGLFNLLLFLGRLISFFILLVELKIVARLFLAHVVNLSIEKFLTERIGCLSVCDHGIFKDIEVIYCSRHDIVVYITLQIIKIFLICCNLFWFPFFVDCLS